MEPSCTSGGWTSRARPTCSRSRWTSCGPPGPDDAGRPEPALLGDVVLCPEVAARQAGAAGHSTDDELHLLTTHGVLHLLGYDHAEPDEEQEMFAPAGASCSTAGARSPASRSPARRDGGIRRR